MDNEQDFAVSLGAEPRTDTTTSPAVLQNSECRGGPEAPRGSADEEDD